MATSTWTVAGKTALVTGAARGIGAESARRLAAQGMNVSLVGLEPELLERTAAGCGGNAAWFEADVTDREQLQAAVDGTLTRFGRIDATVANAGIQVPGPVRLLEPDSFERAIEVNLLGTYRTVHACLPEIVARSGYVLVVSSAAAIMHGAGTAAYSASKAGAEAFANSLRAELRHHGVDVGIAYFGFVETEVMAGVGRHPALAGRIERLPAPMRRMLPAGEAGQAIAGAVRDRSRSVAAPRSLLRAMLTFRSLFTWMAGAGSSSGYGESERAFEREVQRRGSDASRPLGAGGEASMPGG